LHPQLLKGKAFILKNLAYDSVHRADLFKLPCETSKLEAYLARPDITISPQQPWILQEFIKVHTVTDQVTCMGAALGRLAQATSACFSLESVAPQH
jgi:hypothetical protein